MAWRWVEINAFDDAFNEAVKKCAAEIGDTSPIHVNAIREVAHNREKYGLPTYPTRGYCGLAGAPHALPTISRR